MHAAGVCFIVYCILEMIVLWAYFCRDAPEVNGSQKGLPSEKSAELNGKATAAAAKAVNSRKRKAKQPAPSSSSTDEETNRKNREKEARKNTVKVLGGEIIRQWQTKSRNKGTLTDIYCGLLCQWS